MRENYTIELGVVTVTELIEILQSLPKRCMNWLVYCCGTDMFICVNEEKCHVIIDMEDNFDDIEDFDDLIEAKRKAFPWD